MNGTGPKKVLVRAIGPSLGEFGIAAPLPDPVLELHDAAGAIVATNDDWAATQKAQIQASGLAPGDAAEAALIAELNPGAYTAVVRGAGSQTGVGLAEIYDLDAAAPAIVGNLSTRGFVQTGANVVIGGFILGGTGTAEVVVRALRPSLAAAGLAGTLTDSTLDLRNADGVLVAANDDWAETQEAEIQASGLAPGDTREAAIRQTLAAGSYTATVAGRNGETGIGLIEIYRLP